MVVSAALVGGRRQDRKRRYTNGLGEVGGLTFSYTGSGASAFLTRIDDVANEGGSGAKKNWQLWVNTSYADKSFGVYEVQPLDVVFWRFTTQAGK